MPFDTTILNKKIDGFKEALQNGRFGDALAGALKTVNDTMRNRIFDSNVDTEGQSFGQYIGKKRKVKLVKSKNRTQNKRNKNVAGLFLTAYQEKRARLGRPISRKDLEFSGGLRRAIETQVENEKAAVLQFSNDFAATVAHGQENQISNIRNGVGGSTKGSGTKIFRLNQVEKEQVIDQGTELIKQILKPK